MGVPQGSDPFSLAEARDYRSARGPCSCHDRYWQKKL